MVYIFIFHLILKTRAQIESAYERRTGQLGGEASLFDAKADRLEKEKREAHINEHLTGQNTKAVFRSLGSPIGNLCLVDSRD